MEQILEKMRRAGYNRRMREIAFDTVVSAAEECVKACLRLDPAAERALRAALAREDNPNAAFALSTLLENASVAQNEGLTLCQDTGMAVFFVRLGQDAHITGGLLEEAVNEGVRRGYRRYGCRASVLDPVTRVNTGDNTPAIIHIETTAGDKIELDFLPKGFGSENMTRLYMLTPSAGLDGVVDAVVDAVKTAGSKPCPPVIVGVGIGGTFDKALCENGLAYNGAIPRRPRTEMSGAHIRPRIRRAGLRRRQHRSRRAYRQTPHAHHRPARCGQHSMQRRTQGACRRLTAVAPPQEEHGI